MKVKVFLVLLTLIVFACASHKDYSQDEKKLVSFSSCAYLGAFSSVSTIKNDSETVFNESLTAYSNYVYDSVIRRKVKNIIPVDTRAKMTEVQVKILTTDLTESALSFRKTKDLKSIPRSLILDSIASLYEGRYTSYFINYGNIWSKKQNRKYIAGIALIATVAIIGFALLVVLAAQSKTHTNYDSFLTNDNTTVYPEPVYSGMNCYYMVYDKEKKKICYIRHAFFDSDKTDNNPFNPARVASQVESMFSGCLLNP